MELPKTKNKVLKVEDAVVYLELTRGHVVVVDVDDLAAVGIHRWQSKLRKTRTFEASAVIEGKLIRLHKYITQSQPQNFVKFANGDTLDCRRANLVVLPQTRRKKPNRILELREDGTAVVEITKDAVTIMDQKDLPLLDNHRVYLLTQQSGKKYAVCKSDKKRVYLHRLLTNAGPDHQVDHINGDSLDNRRQNLRLCVSSQNNSNRPGRDGTSRFKGVSWVKAQSKWMARIGVGYRTHYLGYFTSEAEAAVAYDIAALKLHGEFARTNILLTLPQEVQ